MELSSSDEEIREELSHLGVREKGRSPSVEDAGSSRPRVRPIDLSGLARRTQHPLEADRLCSSRDRASLSASALQGVSASHNFDGSRSNFGVESPYGDPGSDSAEEAPSDSQDELWTSDDASEVDAYSEDEAHNESSADECSLEVRRTEGGGERSLLLPARGQNRSTRNRMGCEEDEEEEEKGDNDEEEDQEDVSEDSDEEEDIVIDGSEQRDIKLEGSSHLSGSPHQRSRRTLRRTRGGPGSADVALTPASATTATAAITSKSTSAAPPRTSTLDLQSNLSESRSLPARPMTSPMRKSRFSEASVASFPLPPATDRGGAAKSYIERVRSMFANIQRPPSRQRNLGSLLLSARREEEPSIGSDSPRLMNSIAFDNFHRPEDDGFEPLHLTSRAAFSIKVTNSKQDGQIEYEIQVADGSCPSRGSVHGSEDTDEEEISTKSSDDRESRTRGDRAPPERTSNHEESEGESERKIAESRLKRIHDSKERASEGESERNRAESRLKRMHDSKERESEGESERKRAESRLKRMHGLKEKESKAIARGSPALEITGLRHGKRVVRPRSRQQQSRLSSAGSKVERFRAVAVGSEGPRTARLHDDQSSASSTNQEQALGRDGASIRSQGYTRRQSSDRGPSSFDERTHSASHDGSFSTSCTVSHSLSRGSFRLQSTEIRMKSSRNKYQFSSVDTASSSKGVQQAQEHSKSVSEESGGAEVTARGRRRRRIHTSCSSESDSDWTCSTRRSQNHENRSFQRSIVSLDAETYTSDSDMASDDDEGFFENRKTEKPHTHTDFSKKTLRNAFPEEHVADTSARSGRDIRESADRVAKSGTETPEEQNIYDFLLANQLLQFGADAYERETESLGHNQTDARDSSTSVKPPAKETKSIDQLNENDGDDFVVESEGMDAAFYEPASGLLSTNLDQDFLDLFAH